MVHRPNASRACPLSAVVALTLVFVWSSLTDHTFVLHDALPAWLEVNPRVFFLLGIAALCPALISSHDALRRKDASLKVLFPVIGALGTACIAFAPYQDLFHPGVLCMTGLIALGMGYCWLVVRFGLLMAHGPSLSPLVYGMTIALILEPVVRLFIETLFPYTARICVASLLPVLSMTLLRQTERGARENGWVDEARRTCACAPQSESRTLLNKRFVLFFAIAILLATVRTLSPVGTWDAQFNPAPMTSSPALVALYAAGVVLFARFTLISAEQRPVLSRFQLAFLLIVLTLSASLLMLYTQGPQSAALYTLMCLNDSFAHLLFWTAVVCMARSVAMPPYRLVGMAVATYALGSIIWLFVIGCSEMLQTVATAAAVAMLYVLTIVIVHTGGPDAAASDSYTRNGNGSDSACGANDTPATTRIAASIEERCREVAGEYKLSPRETEVLALLAQGRTRMYIQEKLVLAEPTVKTHIAHIYRKTGVNNRQGLIDLVLGGDE